MCHTAPGPPCGDGHGRGVAEPPNPVPKQLRSWHPGRWVGVHSPPGTDDGHAARRLYVVLLAGLSRSFLRLRTRTISVTKMTVTVEPRSRTVRRAVCSARPGVPNSAITL